MPRARFTFVMIAACALMLSAARVDAQTPPAGAAKPPAPRAPAAPAAKPLLQKPYKPIAVTVTPAPDDPSFAAFRQQLADVAKNRVYAELARLVVAQGFFWAGDFAGGFDPKKSSAENFAAAIRLERGAGSGWSRLAAFAAWPDAAPMASRPGVICTPSPPQFDEIEFDHVLDITQTKASDWNYPRAAGAPMRAAARPTAAVIETLGSHLVRRLENTSGNAANNPAGQIWTRVAAPSGRTGFVAAAELMPLRGDQICYLKDVTGRWSIAGYVAVGD